MVSTCTSDGIRAILADAGLSNPVPPHPLANIESSPLSLYLSFLTDTLVQLTGCTPEAAWDSIQWPNDFGDLAVVVPRLRLKDIKPSELPGLTHKLQQTFPPGPLFDHPFEDGINLRFYFKPDLLSRLLPAYIIDRGKNYGRELSVGLRDPENLSGGRKKVIVECSSPNIGKEFDGFHSRSTLVGTYISSLFEVMGWDVVRTNFIGDWGKHIGLLAAAWSRFQSEELFQSDPVAHLLDIFKQINSLHHTEQNGSTCSDDSVIDAEKDEFFRKLEDRDAETVALWERFRGAFTARYNRLYDRIGLPFDDQSGESNFKQETMDKIETVLKEKNLYEQSDGAWVITLDKLEIPGLSSTIARYRNGTTSYLLRDLAAFYERREKYAFDMMIYVASSHQNGHFHQLFKILELLGHPNIDNQLKHISIGKMQSQTSPPESSGILLEDILNTCRAAVQALVEADRESMSEFAIDEPGIADALGIAGLKVQDLSHKHNASLVVDVEKVATADGHTGIALQQWYIALKAKVSGSTITRETLDGADLSILTQEEYSDVLRILIQFPDMVKNAFKQPSYESTTLLTYLFRVTDSLAPIWDDEQEDDAGTSTSSKDEIAKLALLDCVRQVLHNGMRVLGIVPLEM